MPPGRANRFHPYNLPQKRTSYGVPMTLPDGSGASQADPLPGVVSTGSVNLLAGASGVGKTCLTATICATLRDGLPLFGHPTNTPAEVGYICADRGWGSARYWLEKAGFPDIKFYSLCDDAEFQPARLRKRENLVGILGECLDKLKLAKWSFVVVDPLALFMGGNLNDYQACAVALIEIRRLITRRCLTILGLAHAGKQKNDRREQYTRLQDRILGSSAQHGYGDTQMYLASPQETGERHYTFLWHPHTAPAQTFELGRNQDGMFVPWAAGLEVMELEDEKVLAEIPEAEAGVGFGDLCHTLLISRSTVHRRLQGLIAKGRVESAGHGRYRRCKAH